MKLMERLTGKTEAQRIVARNPDAKFPLCKMTDAEMTAYFEGEDWTVTGPQRQADREAGE